MVNPALNNFPGGQIELKDISEKLKQNLGEHDSDSYVFTWQEKVFSRVSWIYFSADISMPLF